MGDKLRPSSQSDSQKTQVISPLNPIFGETKRNRLEEIHLELDSSQVNVPTSEDYDNVTSDNYRTNSDGSNAIKDTDDLADEPPSTLQQNIAEINKFKDVDSDELSLEHHTQKDPNNMEDTTEEPNKDYESDQISFHASAKEEILKNIGGVSDNSWLKNAKDPFALDTQEVSQPNIELPNFEDMDDSNASELKAHEMFEKLRGVQGEEKVSDIQDATTQKISNSNDDSLYVKFSLDQTNINLSPKKLENILDSSPLKGKTMQDDNSTQILLSDTQGPKTQVIDNDVTATQKLFFKNTIVSGMVFTNDEQRPNMQIPGTLEANNTNVQNENFSSQESYPKNTDTVNQLPQFFDSTNQNFIEPTLQVGTVPISQNEEFKNYINNLEVKATQKSDIGSPPTAKGHEIKVAENIYSSEDVPKDKRNNTVFVVDATVDVPNDDQISVEVVNHNLVLSYEELSTQEVNSSPIQKKNQSKLKVKPLELENRPMLAPDESRIIVPEDLIDSSSPKKDLLSKSEDENTNSQEVSPEKSSFKKRKFPMIDDSENVEDEELPVLSKRFLSDNRIKANIFNEEKENEDNYIEYTENDKKGYVENTTINTTMANEISANYSREDNLSVWIFYEFKYYPAKILRKINDEVEVQCYDSRLIISKNDLVDTFSLEPGNLVSVNSKYVQYVVTDLSFVEPSQRSGEEEFEDFCTNNGFNTVTLTPFKKKSKKAKKLPPKPIEVSIWYIYMNQDQWTKRSAELRPGGLEFKITDGDIIREENVARSRNKTKGTLSRVQSYVSSTNPSPNKSPIVSDIFQHMVFCITGKEDSKDNLSSLIQANGGIILKEGLSDILDFTKDEEDNLQDVKLSTDFINIKFAAVLSGTHYRSIKYLQAVALGWPVLSNQFIYDCISQSQFLDSWYSYRLVAGESKILNCYQGIDLFKFRQSYLEDSKICLNDQLNNNKHVFKNCIVFLMKDKPKICEFLFFILGAKTYKIKKYSDNLFKQIEKINNDLLIPKRIFVYDNTLSSKEIQSKLSSVPLRSKSNIELSVTKRRSSNKRAKTTDQKNLNNTVFSRFSKSNLINLHLINWEWVVQCVISNNCWPADDTFVLQ